MADTLKVVAARIQSTSLPAGPNPTLQPQPPRFGVVIEEESGEPSPEEVRTVLWQDGLVQDVQADTVAGLNLDVIENPETETLQAFTGQVVRRIAPDGALPRDPSGGTSAQYTGIVAGIYKRTPIEDEAGTGEDFLLVYVGADTFFEGVASTFAVEQNR